MKLVCLLLLAVPALVLADYDCAAVGDQFRTYCDENCNHNPSYCPPEQCGDCVNLDADSDDDTPVDPDYIWCPDAELPAWCEQNCNHNPPFCPASFCAGCNFPEGSNLTVSAPETYTVADDPECAVYTPFWCQSSCTHDPPDCPDCCIAPEGGDDDDDDTNRPCTPDDCILDCNGDPIWYDQIDTSTCSNISDSVSTRLDCPQRYWNGFACANFVGSQTCGGDFTTFFIKDCTQGCIDILQEFDLFTNNTYFCRGLMPDCNDADNNVINPLALDPENDPVVCPNANNPCGFNELPDCSGTCQPFNGTTVTFISPSDGPGNPRGCLPAFNCSQYLWGFGNC